MLDRSGAGLALAGFLVLATGCGGTALTTGGSSDTDASADAGPTPGNDSGVTDAAPPRTPKVHRPTALTCDPTRPPSMPDAPDSGGPEVDSGIPNQCSYDGDCASGTNGRCLGMRIGYVCTYDACATDADCKNGTVCQCRANPKDLSATFCVQDGNCRVDADCGAAGACSPSFGTCGSYGGIQGYFCHTPADECVDDTDCVGPHGEGQGYCMMDSTKRVWVCGYGVCAG